MGAVSDAVDSAANSASDAVGSALSWMKSKPRNSELGGDDFKPDVDELQAQKLLKKIAELDLQLAAGEISTEEYQFKWSDLKAQIPFDQS